MPGFGERLKNERETRNTTIEDLAAASGIGRGYLEALERDEFDALPGRAFGKFYIRVYAEILGFDAGVLIDAYDREQKLEPMSAAEPSSSGRPRPRRVQAAIAQWRESRLREQSHPDESGPPSGARSEDVTEIPSATVADDPERAHAEAGAPEGPERAVAAVAPVSEAGAEAVIPETAVRSSRRFVVVIVLALLAAAAVTYSAFVLKGTEAPRPHASVAAERALPSNEPPPVDLARATPPPAAPPEPPAAIASTGSGRLSVAESGIGRRIVDRRLEGRDGRFAKGDVVWFSTRVLGGESGGHIRHVWVYAGRVLHSVELGLGGPDWRTYSRQTLGAAGSWAAEARDETGRVLARETFTCESP